MSEESTVRQIINLGVEATHGTSVATTKRMQGMMGDITVKTTPSPFRPSGQKYNSVVEILEEWTEMKISGDALYSELQYWLSSLFGAATIAQNGTSDNLGYSWTWNPSTSAEDTPKTFTVENGEANRARKFSYGLCTDLTFQWDRKKAVTLSGTVMGQLMTDGATLTPVVDNVWSLTTTGTPAGGTFTMTAVVNGSTQTTATIPYDGTSAQVATALGALTNIGVSNVSATGGPLPTAIVITFSGELAGQEVTLTTTDSLTGGSTPATALSETTPGSGPSVVPVAPVLPTQIDVYLDTTAANIGTTQLTRVFTGEFAIGGKFKPIWVLNSSNTSYAGHIEAIPKATAKILVEADSAGMALLDDMRAGTTVFLRFKATGAQIDASPAFDYLFQVDLACQVSAPETFKDQDGVYAIGWDFELVNDDSWGKAMSLLIHNRNSSL